MSGGGLAKALHLREGEARPLAILGAYLLLATATTTVLSATKNGLFLSVYPGRLIPHAVIAAALLTAVVAVVFTGVIAGTARRSLALWLTVFLVATLGIARAVFGITPRSSFALYLWISAVQVLVLTHAWDYVGDLLTGRQAKRLMPLIGIGASVGALLGGVSVAPAVLTLGTANMLLVAGALLLLGLPLLWLVRQPVRPPDESETMDVGAIRAFLAGAGRGFRAVSGEPLLRVMGGAIIFLSLTSTLVELQFKLSLQENFTEDDITAVYGLMVSVVGLGTLVLQLVASRYIFPKLGVSFAAMLHTGVLTFAAAGAAVFTGFAIRAVLQILDDTLQHSLQKPVEQVSLLPFPGATKSAAVATLGGVLRPLSKAAGGAMAILMVSQGRMLQVATVISAAAGFAVILRHRQRYLAALEHALARHSVDFGVTPRVPLVADREALAVLDRGLKDVDPTVVVFSLSLLENVAASDALPRVAELIDHSSAEVRGQAAQVLGQLDLDGPEELQALLIPRLAAESSPFVLASVVAALGGAEGTDPSVLRPFAEHEDERVRREAFVALSRLGVEDVERRLRALLRGEDSIDRAVGAWSAGRLRMTALMGDLASVVEDDRARPVALQALADMGEVAIPVLSGLLERRALPLPVRRGVVTTLAAIPHPMAREKLLSLVDEPALGPPALTSLRRLRSDGLLDAVDSRVLRRLLTAEVTRGFRYAVISQAVREHLDQGQGDFLAGELEGLRERSLHRCIRILMLSYDPKRLESVRFALLSGSATQRSNALELLEGVLAREDAERVIPFVETSADGFSIGAAEAFVDNTMSLLARPLDHLLDDPDWWPRALGLHALGRDEEIPIPGRDPDHPSEAVDMIPLIERVMILKGSQLFRFFPGSDLAGIASLAEEVHLKEDEIVFRQGEEGDAFYMVVRGGVRIMRGSHELAVLGPREGFGEMAILDQETRSATATAAEDTTLLRIDRDSFDRLVEQNPSVARGIYRMLTQRLRNTLAQVAAG